VATVAKIFLKPHTIVLILSLMFCQASAAEAACESTTTKKRKLKAKTQALLKGGLLEYMAF
jgi:hypothetical protein